MKYNLISSPLVRLGFILLFLKVSPTIAQTSITNHTWIDDLGKHSLVIEKEIKEDNSGEHLSVKQITKGNIDWILKDYVNDCDLDAVLDVVSESVEVNVDAGTVLFAYKIGCIGGLDPVTVKYFAYRNGVKHTLRGEEHIVIGSSGYGGEQPPAPDFNLRNDSHLLDYMLRRWGDISMTKHNWLSDFYSQE